MFFRVEEVPTPPVNQGAQVTVDGPIRFFSKLDNEYRGFSNFAPSPVTIDGKRYPTVEHYFQASRFPSDIGWQEAIRVAPTPAKAKQLGSQTDHPVRPDWDTQKESIMLAGLRAKFQQNSGLLEQLKGTGKRPLIEASTDAYWGEGRTGKGKNRMGKLLEQVREELREYVLPATEALAATEVTQAKAPEEFYEGDEEELVEEPPVEPPKNPEPLKSIADVLGLQGGGGPEEDHTIILTSDQKVLLISLRKEKVLNSLQTLMKSVAVDCQLNFQDNNDGTFRCMALGDSIGDFAYHPDLQKDIQETEARFKVAPSVPVVPVVPVVPGPKKILYKGKGYYYKLHTNTKGEPLGYIFYNKEDPGLTSPIGYVLANVSNKMPTGEILPVPADVN
jgi:hypothetical protein